MTQFEEGLKILEEKCGNNKDNIISLATIAINSKDGNPIPSVRDVDAYYEDGVFYVVTYAKSNKMLEIANNQHIAFSVNFENISGTAIGENLGWVLDPKNAGLRTKLREVFAKWYDEANNEQDVNFCYLAIRITKATVVTGHGPTTKKYYLDFVNKREFDEVKDMLEREAYYVTFKGEHANKEGRDYIFKFLSDNKIDLLKEKGPIYIFGGYDVTKKQDAAFEYTLYFILPKQIRLTVKPKKKTIFGGTYARRYTDYSKQDLDIKDLYETFKTDDKPTMIYEQYLLDKHEFSQDTRIFLMLEV